MKKLYRILLMPCALAYVGLVMLPLDALAVGSVWLRERADWFGEWAFTPKRRKR